ncbi:hypothetical protein QJS66_11765 [Kocuria rhizophila]|nr:hypothetical protein QJS66_11765 [Kocuria rhizophila]
MVSYLAPVRGPRGRDELDDLAAVHPAAGRPAVHGAARPQLVLSPAPARESGKRVRAASCARRKASARPAATTAPRRTARPRAAQPGAAPP